MALTAGLIDGMAQVALSAAAQCGCCAACCAGTGSSAGAAVASLASAAAALVAAVTRLTVTQFAAALEVRKCVAIAAAVAVPVEIAA